jgi:hypothetical protein
MREIEPAAGNALSTLYPCRDANANALLCMVDYHGMGILWVLKKCRLLQLGFLCEAIHLTQHRHNGVTLTYPSLQFICSKDSKTKDNA